MPPLYLMPAVRTVLAFEPNFLTMLTQFTLNFFTAFLPVTLAVAQICWRDTICEDRTSSFIGDWDQYKHSPSSRTVSPANILLSDLTVLSTYPGDTTLTSNGSLLIFDFGKEVGGMITVNWEATGSGSLGLAFSEASNWTGTASDGSDGTYHPGGDGALYAKISDTTTGTYTAPDANLRGGFRYLSVFTLTDATINVNITSVTLEIAFQPTWSDLTAYGGYFYSNDELINRIWYAGAYTLQTNAVPPNTGREYPLLESGWKNDAFLGTNGSTIFVDGSKRDRATWAGDLGIALPSVFVSIGDSESAKNALQLQYDSQVSSCTLLQECHYSYLRNSLVQESSLWLVHQSTFTVPIRIICLRSSERMSTFFTPATQTFFPRTGIRLFLPWVSSQESLIAPHCST